MKHRILSSRAIFSVAGLLLLFASCQSDMADLSLDKKPGDSVEFGASVHGTSGVKTRTLEYEYIESTTYDTDFYIQLCCGTETELKTYIVPSGYEGRLEPKGEAEGDTLKWYDLDSPHSFYAWTIPWDESWEAKAESLTVKFENSSDADSKKAGYDAEKRNNAILEKFIGTRSEEKPDGHNLSYKEHGKYVELTFFHLVSKIKIGSFILIEANGSIQKDLKADVTFVGMPTEATFYPHPEDDRRPYVGEPYTTSEDDGITYFLANEAAGDDVFYICPEVDFSKINFKVKLISREYLTYDTYYGTFDDVTFIREPGSDYDKGGDEKILHAGEMMTLNITLIPGVGPGLSLVITPWSTEDPEESQYHAYPGIYSDAEVKEMHGSFVDNSFEDAQAEAKRLFETYGEKRDIDGDGELEMVFPLYDNVDVTGATRDNIFPIPNGYILDGMGHTITMKTNTNNTDYVTAPYFNIGPVRNVWLTDGTHTIFIDIEGYVWIEDAAAPTGYKQTGYQLKPLTGNEKSYDISCNDGKVHNSDFYNYISS